MNIYLTNAFNQVKQFVADFPKDSLPVILVKDAAFLISGWNATARIVDHISKNHSFVKEIKTPISVFGAFSIVLLSHISFLSAAGTVAILAAIAFDSTKVKMTYSPQEFKNLLLQKQPFPPNIIVTGNLNLSNCTELTSLPEGLTVKGDLDLSGCIGLTSLPEGLIVKGGLYLLGCTGLTSLPERLTVGGDLNLCGCTGLTSLPEGLTVGGNLYLSGCTGLASLPEGLTVGGNLYLSGCTGLTSLPERLTVGGDLNLCGCTGLTSLPEGLTVGGNLYLLGCTGLTSLPERLTVGGDLNLCGCTGLTSLPEGLTVGGNLYLSGCTGLASLPEGLIVKGGLYLLGCTGLTSLPERLTVGGDLNLCGCTGLTSLPGRLTVGGGLNLSDCTGLASLSEGLIVGGHLTLSGCTGLTSLPNWITTLGPRADGNTRQISLERMGLSQDLLTRLSATPVPGIQFYLSNAASVPTQIFPDLDTALTFWVKATNDATLTNPPITVDSEMDLLNVLNFLGRLADTAEYKNLQARPMLAKRVIEAFSLMAKNESIKGRAFTIIHHGLATCDDRIISALEQIELMVLLHKIKNTSHTEEELRALGKRFLLLEMVNEKAKAHTSNLTWVDEIEVYLAFQIGLAKQLDLPVKTRNMTFRRCAQITDEQINQAGDAVVKECTEEKLNNFLKSWSPWIEHQRKNGPVPAYEKLPFADRELESGEICPITQYIPGKPVFYGKTVYDYYAFIEYYRTNGKDPLDTRSEIDLEKLQRMKLSD
jgi:hypothetical protein